MISTVYKKSIALTLQEPMPARYLSESPFQIIKREKVSVIVLSKAECLLPLLQQYIIIIL